MIVDDCKSLVKSVGEYKRLRENSIQVGRFEKVHAVLGSGTIRLVPLVAAFRTLRDANIADIDIEQEANELLAMLVQGRVAFAERPESLINTKVFDPVKVTKGIEALARQLEEQLSFAWLQYTEERIPATRREVLDVLAVAFPAEVGLLRQQAEKLERIRHVIPTTQAAIVEFEADVRALQSAWAQVGGGDVPTSVTSFLQAAASQSGARIDMFSDEVRQWITEHNILESFSIKVAN